MTRTYKEVTQKNTFLSRYRYLRLRGKVGEQTFAYERYLNQRFYRSYEWKRIRSAVIARDEGCDLAFPGREVHSNPIVHHIQPLTPDDIKHGTEKLLSMDNLILTSLNTHNAIHYGDDSFLEVGFVERVPGDTTPWS